MDCRKRDKKKIKLTELCSLGRIGSNSFYPIRNG